MKATIVTENGVVADVVVNGNSFRIVDGTIRKAASSGLSALDTAFAAAARNVNRGQIVLGADDDEQMRKSERDESLGEHFDRVTREAIEGGN
jgi:hypothetical protein